MNPARQFRILFRFQLLSIPYIWFLPIAFCAPLLFTHSGYESLSLILPMQNLFFVGFLGVLILAPEIFYTSAAPSQMAVFSSEFLLTRAINRTILARAKSGCFYVITLVIPIVLVAVSLKNPDLKVVSYSKIEQQECLASIPGSMISKDAHGRTESLVIPAGNRLVSVWHCWEVVTCATVAQALIFLIYPWPYRKLILWFVFGVVISFPLTGIYFHHEPRFTSEHWFFTFAAHQTIVWIGTILFVLLAQLWSERRFAGLEQ